MKVTFSTSVPRLPVSLSHITLQFEVIVVLISDITHLELTGFNNEITHFEFALEKNVYDNSSQIKH